MEVEFICVGTELLLGNIVNTNAAYLAEQCAMLGLTNYYQTTVGDNEKRLFNCIEESVNRSDIVILTGGLGPTEDDLTKEVACKVLKKELVCDEESKRSIAEYFEKKGTKPTENNWKQALVPKDCIVLKNNNGTAPGIIIEDDNCKVILLPGPTNELIPMFEESVIPYLKKLSPEVILSKTVKLCGVSESTVETMIKDLIDNQSNPTLATNAKTGEVHIRVTAKADNKDNAKKLIKPYVLELKNRFGASVYTTNKEVTLEEALVKLLKKNGLTISCAESCTGGLCCGRLVNVPGVSDVLKCSFVTYSNKAKRKLLGVDKETLKKYGAVSKETAIEMAVGLAKETKALVTISITGIAGPDGGSTDKPVGLVYMACYIDGKVTVRKHIFTGNRAKVRESAVSYALTLARNCVLEYSKKLNIENEK